jgi:hypothetical protein
MSVFGDQMTLAYSSFGRISDLITVEIVEAVGDDRE